MPALMKFQLRVTFPVSASSTLLCHNLNLPGSTGPQPMEGFLLVKPPMLKLLAP